ncbi:A24 family peptidase [Muricomes intestini]
MQRFIYMAYLKGAGIILFLALLLYIAWTDYKIKRIPDKYTAALLLWGIIWARFYPAVPLQDRVAGGTVVSGILLILSLIRPGCFGGGDIKLMAAAGILTGLNRNIWAFVLAVLLAGIHVCRKLLVPLPPDSKRRRESFAFGPFLCVGIIAAILFGDCLTDWFWHG